MAERETDEIDRQVRESFGLEPAAVRRVVAGARAASERRPRRARVLPTALAAAAVGALAAAVVWWPRPEVVPAPANVVVSGTLDGNVLVLTFPDGSTSILAADRGDERPLDGSGIVLVDGGLE